MVSRKKSARKPPKKSVKEVDLEWKILILMVAKIGQKCYHYYLKLKSAVEVVLPVKQGLKRIGPYPADRMGGLVEVVLPVKQGLKPDKMETEITRIAELKWFFQ